MFDGERLNRQAAAQWWSQGLLPDLSRVRSSEVRPPPASLVPDSSLQSGPAWFKDALAHVDLIDVEAQEEGFPTTTDVAKRSAKHVLAKIRSSFIEPDVYPSIDGEIALYFKSSVAAAGLLILIDSKGCADCFWSADGKNEREHYKDAWDLPADVVRGRLRMLGALPLFQSLD